MNDDEDDVGRLLATLQDWAATGQACAIATVIKTWGSAPRRAGAHLIIRDDGMFEGSVSGGCVEGDVIATALELLPHGRSRLLEYGVADAKAWEVGLACGGRIEILVQPVAEGGFPLALAERIRAERQAGRTLAVTTDLASGESREGADPGDGRFVGHYAPRLRLAVVGAVHIAQALLPMARMAGYAPLLIDPRALFATTERFGQQIDSDWPDTALTRWKPDAASAIVTLSHDPKLDDPALATALRSDAFYIGALGSRRNQAQRLERLAAAGFSSDELERIRGPVGLAIGAANPAEIAISILAQMTATLRGANP
jgi:xanthine dehydrogenase accessory factor